MDDERFQVTIFTFDSNNIDEFDTDTFLSTFIIIAVFVIIFQYIIHGKNMQEKTERKYY